MAKAASIRIDPNLLPNAPSTTVEIRNVKGEWMQVVDSLPLLPEETQGLRQILQQTSVDGTPRVVLIAREYDIRTRKHLSSCALGALYGVGLDGRKTLLVDVVLGNYDLLEPLAREVREVSKMANLACPAQVIGALVPSHELLREAGFQSYPWCGHDILTLEAA